MWDGCQFGGAKIALLCPGGVITYKRDRKPGIPFPGMWDLPGGGREGDETPVACALREVHEEFGLKLPAGQVIWERQYSGHVASNLATFFFVGQITASELRAIAFGDEGETWKVMSLEDFLSDPTVIGHLQQRLSDYLAAIR